MKHLKTYETVYTLEKTIGKFIFHTFMKGKFQKKKIFTGEYNYAVHVSIIFYSGNGSDSLFDHDLEVITDISKYLKPYVKSFYITPTTKYGTSVWTISFSFTREKMEEIKKLPEFAEWELKIDAQKYNL